MKRSLVLIAVSFALLGAEQNTAPVSAPAPPSEHPPQLARVDETFAVAALQGDDAEIEAAQLALGHTSADGVASFARLMLIDHGEIAKEGDALLRRHLAQLPPRVAPPDALALQYLAHVSPVDFDQNYALLQIADHLAAQAAFATEARDGSDLSSKPLRRSGFRRSKRTCSSP